MSQHKNSTAPVVVQQAETVACQFSCMPSGHFILSTVPGVPLDQAMAEASRILDGTWMLLRRVEDDGDGDLLGLEVGAIRLLVETAAALQTSCRRGIAALQGGDQ